jgi:hypothetical protein
MKISKIFYSLFDHDFFMKISLLIIAGKFDFLFALFIFLKLINFQLQSAFQY